LTHAIKTSGKGVKVLVFATGAEHIDEAADAGMLPNTGAIWVDPNFTGTGDEGTAMLELVHAIAPIAKLGFCAATTALISLSCLTDEAAHFQANIIVSDLSTTGEDVYHVNGLYLRRLRSFLSAHPSLVYLHDAGNSALTYFQGSYTPSANTRTIDGHHYRSVEDFGLSTGKASDTKNTFSLPAGGSAIIELQWKDDWSKPAESYAIYLLDNAGKVLAHAVTHQHPFRVVQYANKGSTAKTINLVVACGSSACAQPFFVKDYPLSYYTFEYNTPGSADALGVLNGVFNIGAVNVATPTKIEAYSSTGPALADGSIQPAFVAPDCVDFVDVGNFNASQFCGTSAAAPQVAGVLALLESSPLPGGVQTLIDGAVDLGAKGQDNIYGYGRIDAKAAEASLDTPPTVKATAAFTVTAGRSHSGQLKGALSQTATQAGLALHYAIVKQPGHGTIKLDATSGAYTYTAASGYSGSDQFTFASNDGLTQSKQQTAAVTVKPASTTPPEEHPGSSHGGGGSSGPLALLGLLLFGIPFLGKAH
jgi:hypothetical protein